jgi:hypothetical protein
MKAPSDDMPRDLDEILTEAVKLIKTLRAKSGRILPPDSVEAFRAQLKARIEWARDIHQRTADMPPPGEMKDRATDYLKVLRRAKKHAEAVRPLYWSDDFIAALDQEIIEVDARTCLVVRKDDGPRGDHVADVATIMARDLIDPDPYRHPENRGKDLPAIDCPWRQPATLTRGGAWLELASLVVEGATGVRPRDMMEYCRNIDKKLQQPRYRSGRDNPPPGGPRRGNVTDARSSTPKTQIAVYDGTDRLGSLRRDGASFTAFDRLGRPLGTFSSERVAIAAIDGSNRATLPN